MTSRQSLGIRSSEVADLNVTPLPRHVCGRMAFPIPSHLSKKQPTDVSSAVLGRISDADSKSLSAALAEVWIADLDESIRAAKVRSLFTSALLDRSSYFQQLIHERIQRDLPSFSYQLAAAESIRSRFCTLKENTDKLSHSISNPQARPPRSIQMSHLPIRSCYY